MPSTSLNVTFVTSTKDTNISAELDESKNIDAEGNPISQFQFGTFAHFLVFVDPKDTQYEMFLSDNTAALKAGGKNMPKQFEEEVTFTPDQSQEDGNLPTLSHIVSSIVSYEWIGNDLGGIVPVGGQAVRCTGKGVGVAKIKYTALANEHSIMLPLPSGPVDDDYSRSVVVFIQTVKR